jgi:hypothetical protein
MLIQFSFDPLRCKLIQVEQIKRTSRYATNLEELIEQDKANNLVKAAQSNSRTLLRLNRALEVVKVLCEQLLTGR